LELLADSIVLLYRRGRTLEEVAIIFDGDRALGDSPSSEPELEKGLPKSSIEHVEDSNKDKASF